MKRTIFIFAALAAAFAAVGQAPEPFHQEGIASWYGSEFEGRMTASGERFDSSQLTAAHQSLPFGTRVIVTNTHNGKKVEVRINDRGPFVPSRIIDVSRAAAVQLDLVATGTAPVEIDAMVVAAAGTDLPQGAEAAPSPSANAEDANQAVPAISASQPEQPATEQTAPAAGMANAVQPAVAAPVVPSPAPSAAALPAPVPAPAPAAAPRPIAAPAAAAVELPPARLLPAKLVPMAGKKYRLQVGSYKMAKNAAETFDKLKSANLSPAYEKNGDYYRVVLTGVPAEKLGEVAATLGKIGFAEALAREEPNS